jgi:hypothetical protein
VAALVLAALLSALVLLALILIHDLLHGICFPTTTTDEPVRRSAQFHQRKLFALGKNSGSSTLVRMRR